MMVTSLRQVARSLRRSAASALAAILTLALTLGAGTALFALLDAYVLTPPPFANPESLVTLLEAPADDPGATPRAVSRQTLAAWRDASRQVLTQLEGYDPTNLTMTGAGDAERASASFVTSGFFAMLGVSPARGHGLEAGDESRRVAVLSDRLWRSRFSADPTILGRDITLGGSPYAIVGVLPSRFSFGLSQSDVWLPMPADGGVVRAMARLAPGATAFDAVDALDRVSARSTPAARVVATPVATAIAGSAATTIPLLVAAAALATLLAVINLTGLLLVRGIDRQHEVAIRTALGASRYQLMKDVWLEAHVLVGLGALTGVLLAFWITPALGPVASQQFRVSSGVEAAIRWRALAALSGAALICAWGCSLASTLRFKQPRLLRRAFVAGEVALAFVLLASVVLVGTSLQRVLAVSPGFDAAGVVTIGVSPPAATYPDAPRLASFYSRLHDALRDRLGADAVAIVDELPLTHDRGRTLVRAAPGAAGTEAVARVASRRYFDVMRIPLVAGREFDASETSTSAPRVVISRSLAAQLCLAGGDPCTPPSSSLAGPLRGAKTRLPAPLVAKTVGSQLQQLWLPAARRMVEVIGVVGDVKHRGLDERDVPTVYFAAPQAPSRSSRIIVRTSRPVTDVVATVRQEVARLDRDLPVYGTSTMEEVLRTSPGVPARRILAASFAGFAILALAVTGIGLFGLMAHDVATQRKDLALRVAIGAGPGRLMQAVFSQAGIILGCGLGAGAGIFTFMSGALRAFLFEIGTTDPLTYVAVIGVLSGVGLLAALPPALRAAKADPMMALRGN